MVFGASVQDILPVDAQRATLVGRVWRPGIGPALAVVRGEMIYDITTAHAPTMSALFELNDVAVWVNELKGKAIGSVEAILANSDEQHKNKNLPFLLSPFDLQAIKAAGVTFAVSMLERVIEEQAHGAPEKAVEIRRSIQNLIGDNLNLLKPGSQQAAELKKVLIEKGVWSQYLEVGIGPDAEIFTKCQVMSSVGFGAHAGIDARSVWNNPEPEIALAVSSTGAIIGATLANDVNLRDFEGRSALLLSKAKDNNASCSLGPFIRVFDEHYRYEDVLDSQVGLHITGDDGFVLQDVSNMQKISRAPADLVNATLSKNHQYPDGFALLLGTMFAPTQDRDQEKSGFTHHQGDIVSISSPKLGRLINRIEFCENCAPWVFGLQAFIKNLAKRKLV